MNDGKTPKRSIFGFILPYLFTAVAIGLLIWLFASQFLNSAQTFYLTNVDSDLIGYTYEETNPGEVHYVLKTYEEAPVKVYSAKVSESEKSVYITGSYATNNNTMRSYVIRMESNKWNTTFEQEAVIDGKNYTVEHASYSSLFLARIEQAASANPDLKKSGQIGYVVEDAYQANFWDVWGPTIIFMAFTIILMIFLYRRLLRSSGGMNSGIMNFNKSPARRADNTKVRFSDVAGCDEEKAEMVELVEYLKDPKKYSRYGARLPKGVLMIGAPGTGKTLLAKAVAGEAGVPFYSISGSDFVEMYVGVGAGRVRDLFHNAKETAPCLIFIDEIDAVGRQRGAGLGGGNDEREQTLNQLLVEMDGFEANSGILVIAATNRDDVLDPALRRAGRFDRTITVSLPDKNGREAILKVHARNKKIDPSVDFAALAKRTVGFSGADLESILNDAAILAVRENKEWIDMANIDEAVDRRISGPAKSSRSMSEHERKQIAYHEAGHAVIGIHLPYSDKVQKITIVPRGNTGGHVLMTPEDDRFLMTKNELLARITGYLGGRTSEEIFFQDVSTGASNDIEVATRIARSMVTEYGMSDLGPIQYERDTGSVFLGRDYASTQKNFSTQIAFEIDKAVRAIVDHCHDEATALLTKYKHEVEMIAETLLEKETITAEEVDYLIAHGTLPSSGDVYKEAIKEEAPIEAPKEEEKSEPSETPATEEAKETALEASEDKEETNAGDKPE
ncbi:MAG: ATP-dependent zinc metalloprotease FtsH [Bacilli bacterium]|nr:ATP-dependent zinc metalloprotease FtsH [Bacilli bacterium]